MSTTNFIPEIWSASVMENFHENTMLTSLANCEYEADLVQGYKVHIPGIVDVQVKDYKTGVTGARTTKTDHPVAIAYYAPVVAYVSQLQQMEAMRAEDFFADRIRGLHVYGTREIKTSIRVGNAGRN